MTRGLGSSIDVPILAEWPKPLRIPEDGGVGAAAVPLPRGSCLGKYVDGEPDADVDAVGNGGSGSTTGRRNFMSMISSYWSDSNTRSFAWSKADSWDSACSRRWDHLAAALSKCLDVFVTTRVWGLPRRSVSCVQSM